jgi:uncharacterized protein (DUF2126 family)/transglutaminase-like putative cysteine protease
MSIHVALNHVTHYRYDRPINIGAQVVRLRPAPHCRTRILSYSLKVSPENHFINWQQDPQSNYLARLVFPEKTQEFKIEVDLVAEMSVINPFDFFLEPYAEEFPFAYDKSLDKELAPYLVKLPLKPRFKKYLQQIPREKVRTIDFLVALNAGLFKHINYLIRLEPGVQTPEETLKKGSGSCRDSAWLLVQLFRRLGLAARFVSGYLIQLKPDVKSLDGPTGADVDFTDLHAWCEVYLPGAGWVGLDPTSGLLAGEGHLPLACSPEPSSAAPITGLLDACECEFEHKMSVERIWEAPRVTKPYTESQWQDIEALGHQVDNDLINMDVRLTMGGEPTFVAVDDPEGAEWNTAALGPTKRLRATELFNKLRDKYAPQGLTHFGQGKWYPGEQLPRWSLNCFWRKDGQAIWSDNQLYADERKSYGADAALAASFLEGVAQRLGLDESCIFPAFEDVYYYMWRERKLPLNVDPHDSRINDEMERERLLKVFSQGLEHIVGHVLPIAWNDKADTWQTGSWFLRDTYCYLVPGDSPLGYRLPLDSQPWVKKEDFPYVNPVDPSANFDELTTSIQHPRPKTASVKTPPIAQQSAAEVTRTALSAEARDGKLYLFMPPLSKLEHYLELVAAIEYTAAALNHPIILEGYEPPSDPRITNFKVTPDPAVIEVNIHPSSTWQELVDKTTHLYETAHLCKLTSEKFMTDGRHTGTGGGNHFVLGGATVHDSPFLRRPDLLRSLISYWHNHPSLSYLFSGLFIGPTSQAPRVDEARNDALYELEIAFKQFPMVGYSCPSWLVDRLLRHLLVDVTGNTHRAEFCIDKLYSPDSSTGRLGLLELRGFEMPPHAQMSLAQQLLIRALIARFWHTPYNPPRLTRWGAELHDRFMLPHFVEQDFTDVIEELQHAGYAIQKDWFNAHFEFRFPKYGDYAIKGMTLEVRHALEPWHVLGEEGASGATVRFVDSSVERVQLKITGLAPDRYVLSCNGESVPLHPTGNAGEFVGGVRYRAWQPPNCLHPTIGVHAPLMFDIVDTWMNRSLGGCQYHVMHAGGRSFDDFPVNSYEAESRRLARFVRMGHTPFQVYAKPFTPNSEHPFVLDLRYK